MERKLCNECQVENICKYEDYINNTARRINDFSSEEEKREAMATISFLKFKAGTKRNPCPRYRELEIIAIPTVVLDKKEG